MVHKPNKWPWTLAETGKGPGFPISVTPTVGVKDGTSWWRGSASVRHPGMTAESPWMSIGWLGNVTSGHWEDL